MGHECEQGGMIGICGGVGPAAGLLLHQYILAHTESGGRDQGHLHICHFSRSEDVTDRTEFLLHRRATTAITNTNVAVNVNTNANANVNVGAPSHVKDIPFSSCSDQGGDTDSCATNKQINEQHKAQATIENPAIGMARTFNMMRAAADCDGSRLVVGVPCNTFHAAPIWDEFVRLTNSNARSLQCKDVNAQFVHMLEETAAFIAQYAPLSRRIGLMSTTGTRVSRVYHDLFEPMGCTIVEVPLTLQSELNEAVYNKTWGIKSTAPVVEPRCVASFHRYARLLREGGADVIVLGCTEIPFAFMGKQYFADCLLVDPMVALARALIRETDSTRLKPLQLRPPRPRLLSTRAFPSSPSLSTPRSLQAKMDRLSNELYD